MCAHHKPIRSTHTANQLRTSEPAANFKISCWSINGLRWPQILRVRHFSKGSRHSEVIITRLDSIGRRFGALSGLDDGWGVREERSDELPGELPDEAVGWAASVLKSAEVRFCQEQLENQSKCTRWVAKNNHNRVRWKLFIEGFLLKKLLVA